MATMRHITILFLLVGFVIDSTTANAIPASILHCVNKFARDCPKKHKDFYCLCGNRQNFLKCLADSSAYGNFLEAKDHFLGTCIEHIPDLSKHPDFNLELPAKVEYSSFPFPSSTLLLNSTTYIETTADLDSRSSFITSTTANSTSLCNYQNPTMSILPIGAPIRNAQPDPTTLPFLPPLGPIAPPFYDIDRDCERECKCDGFDLDCIENKDIEHCIYKCISEKYDEGYDGDGDGDDDVDGNDDCDDEYEYGYEYEYDKCDSEDQKNCLYDDEVNVVEYFKYKQAFLSLPKIDQQNDNINEESAKFWSEEKKARNDIFQELSKNEHSFQLNKSDLKNKNDKNGNGITAAIEKENEYDENPKDYQNPSRDESKEGTLETKKDLNQEENLTSNAVGFKFATPDVMFGNQDPATRKEQLEFEKPVENKEFLLLQSYRKRRNGKTHNKKKYSKKANVNSNLPR